MLSVEDQAEIQALQQSQQPQLEGEPDIKEQVIQKLDTYLQQIVSLDHKHREAPPIINEPEKIAQPFRRLVRNLQTLKSHFEFLRGILQTNSEKELMALKNHYQEILHRYPENIDGPSISLIPVNDVLDTVIKKLGIQIVKITNDFLLQKNGTKSLNKAKPHVSLVQVVASKMENILEYLPPLVALPQSDIFYHGKTSPHWHQLHSAAEFIQMKDLKKLQQSLDKFSGVFTVGTAVLHKTDKVKERSKKKSVSGCFVAMNGACYMAQKKEAARKSSLYLADPNYDSVFSLWRLIDKKSIKRFAKMGLPSIEYDKKIYIPRLFPAITKESILMEYQEQKYETMKNNKFILPDLESQKTELAKTLFQKNAEKVKIRILCSKPVTIQGKTKTKFSIKNMFSKPKPVDKASGVIIHIHGGGFTSMSSSSHRNYLIRWAKATNMIIFSIDYRLAPEDPYPAGLDDVWQAYNWLINYSETILGIPLEKIVLTGDSAGGNLVMSLMLRAIIEEIRLPDGVMLSYPALNLYPQMVFPSYFNAIDDILLPSNVLKLCLKAYIPEGFKPESDPFLSPLIASDELLARLPPLRILSATLDPLHDEIWKFTERLLKLGKDVKLSVYRGLPHGFLSFDQMAEYETVVGQSAAKLVELLEEKREEDEEEVVEDA